MFTPTHIVIAPLNRNTVSLVASVVVELVRSKSSFDLLQLSVISDHDSINQVLEASETKANEPGDEFDVVKATFLELKSLGIPVVSSVQGLQIQSAPVHFGDCSTARAPAEWVLDVDVHHGIADRKLVYAAGVAAGQLRKICYLRLSELDLANTPLSDTEVLVRYGALTEDLPYIPMDIPALPCPARAATAALYPGSLTRRSSVRSVRSRKESSLSRDISLTELSGEVTPILSQIDEQGSIRIEYPMIYALPLERLMHFVVTIISSRFIYEQKYHITGSSFQLPGICMENDSGYLPDSALVSNSFNGEGQRLTPPPSPSTLYHAISPPANFTPSMEPDEVHSPVSPQLEIVPCFTNFEDCDQLSLEEHLQHLHDHAHHTHDVHLSTLVTSSGRTLMGIAAAFQKGLFSVSSSDYQRALHQAAPQLVLIEMESLSDSGATTEGEQGWDEMVYGPLALADQFVLGGGKYVVAVRPTQSLGHDQS
jgi:hypothetical protein